MKPWHKAVRTLAVVGLVGAIVGLSASPAAAGWRRAYRRGMVMTPMVVAPAPVATMYAAPARVTTTSTVYTATPTAVTVPNVTTVYTAPMVTRTMVASPPLVDTGVMPAGYAAPMAVMPRRLVVPRQVYRMP